MPRNVYNLHALEHLIFLPISQNKGEPISTANEHQLFKMFCCYLMDIHSATRLVLFINPVFFFPFMKKFFAILY